jgi:hypothetical protein
MTSQDQARADATAEEQTVDDPLDTSNVPDPGATELAEYNQFVDDLEMGEEGEESPEAPEESDEPEDLKEKPEDEQGEEPAETEEEAEEEPEQEKEDPASGEDDEDEPSNRSGRYRIRAKDEVEAEALSLRKRHPEWSLEQCLTKAKSILGVQETASDESGESGQQAPTPTSADISRQIDELRAKHKEATDNLEFSEAGEIFLQIEKLRDEREELRIEERIRKDKQEQEQYQSMERQFQDSERKAVTYYPETTDPDSAITKRIIELDRQMRDLDDPLYSSPDKPFILAKLAAKELGIPMSNPKAPVKPKRLPTSSRPVNPASGNARTNPKAASPKVDDALAGLDTVEAYEDLVASL